MDAPDPDRQRAEERAARNESEWIVSADVGFDARITELERKFHEAFPNGDWIGHSRYHEIQIEMLLARKRLISAVQEKTLSGLAWATMIFVGLAVWNYIKSQVRL